MGRSIAKSETLQPVSPDARPALSERAVRWHLLAAGLVLACLLCYDLGGRALWTDEGYSLSAGGPLLHAVFGDASHPPGYQFLLHYWLHLAPQTAWGRWNGVSASDGWLRAFNVPWALLAWWLGWLVASRLGLKREGVLAAWLMALSPLVLTYFRIGRYYAMAAALTMLCLLALLWLWERPGWKRALVLGLTVALAGYTDYTALALVLVVLALAALTAAARREGRLCGAFATAGASGLVLLLPLMLMTVQRAATVAAIAADPMAHSLRGLIVKLALPVFSLATGECIDPWRWAITIPALVATVVLLVVGLWALCRQPRQTSTVGGASSPDPTAIPSGLEAPPTMQAAKLLAFVWPLNIIVATGMLSTVAANVPPNRVTSLAMLTIPLAFLLLARGAYEYYWHSEMAERDVRAGRCSVMPRPVILPILALLAACPIGLNNYFRAEQLLNQGYAPPWRQVAQLIEQHEQPGDVIVSTEDVFPRYYDGQAELAFEGDLREMLLGRRPAPRRVWLLTRDRGSQEMLGIAQQLRDKLAAQGARTQVFEVLPRTPQEQKMLSKVLGRPAWGAYVKVYLLERREPGTGNRQPGRP